MRLTAQQFYDKLVYEDRLLELEGQIKFFLGDVNIIVKQKDVVGNIIQEWLQGWLEKRGIEYALNDNTQMPPDFFLNPADQTKDLLEVKAFNRKCDAQALEPTGKHEKYLGRRTKRGLFRSSIGKLINADQNGALNIMRKVVGDSYVSRIVNSGHSLCPVRYSNPFVRIV